MTEIERQVKAWFEDARIEQRQSCYIITPNVKILTPYDMEAIVDVFQTCFEHVFASLDWKDSEWSIYVSVN